MLGSYYIDERPIHAGNACLVESILAVHFRVGLGLVLEQGFEFGLNSGLNKLTKNK